MADADAVARAREDVSPRRVLVAWDDSSSCVPAGVSLDLALAWGAASYTTSSRGHVGLLSDPGLHARVVAHLAAPRRPSPGGRAASRRMVSVRSRRSPAGRARVGLPRPAADTGGPASRHGRGLRC